MKKVTLVVAAASLSLMSFGASAVCQYGNDAKMAEHTETEMVDPNLLALLKEQEDKQELEKKILTYN